MPEEDSIKILTEKVTQLTKAVESLQFERSSLVNTVGVLAGTVQASAMSIPVGPILRTAAMAMSVEKFLTASTGKISREETGERLKIFLGEYCNHTPIFFWHELESIPLLGLDSQKKAGMKGPLEGYVYADVGLELKANDIPPLSTVAELRNKIWNRIPKANKL